ncbi:nucleotidyltransferase domain-containing protein [Adlercreutzia sp. R25]|uniref:nucleotidyltransferase family protein n=1 Tax=Adlercreutzia shanghongiae TaxID=3111773 RepID=UPI002DC00623|nr:nucleotidyltransferase domain-containing protein [Adlercreutzia sp. R25]MEC4272883.1 nucleotidyltransferase domain-containing protein [Adlercreutzia sp. R25]
MSSAADSRVPVAMRLPRREVEIVDEYARAHRITKTEAFLHFLRRGMEGEEDALNGERLSAIERSLEKVLNCLTGGDLLQKSDVLEIISNESQNFSAIKRAILFGSFARDAATLKSDIDIRLELDRDKPFSLYDLARFQKAVGRRTGREVEALTADDIGNANLVAAIEREGIVAYERPRE